LAAALSLAVVFALKSGGQGAESGPLLAGFDVGRVERLEIGSAGGPAITISLSDRVPGIWVMRWKDAGGVERTWPAVASRVRGALRLLGDLRIDPGAAGLAGADGDVRVVLRAADGAERELRLGAGAVAGQTRVRASDGSQDRVALADASLAQVFQAAGVEAWREPSLFGTEIADASRLVVGAPGSEIVLSRVGRSWGMQKPRVEPADEPVITAVLNALASAGAKGFPPRSTAESGAALELSTTRVVVESIRREARGGEMRRWSVVQGITVGGAADVGGTALFASLSAGVEDPATGASTPLWGPVEVTVDRDALNAVPADPAAYVARVASRLAGPDVVAISVERGPPAAGGGSSHRATWKREAGGWRPTGDVAVGAEMDAKLDAILALLTRERAARVVLESKSAYEVRSLLVLETLAGPEERIEAGVFTDDARARVGGVPALVLHRDGVWRVYTGELAKHLAPLLLGT